MLDRLDKGRERLDVALECFAALCEPVPPPRDDLAYMHYFCGNTELPSDLKEHDFMALNAPTSAIVGRSCG